MEYKTILDKIMHYVDRKANYGETVSVANAKRAVRYAYGASKLNIIDDLPDLEFEDHEIYQFSETPFGCYHIAFPEITEGNFELESSWAIIGEFGTLNEAKQAANNDCKERLKKALGI